MGSLCGDKAADAEGVGMMEGLDVERVWFVAGEGGEWGGEGGFVWALCGFT